MKQLFIDKMVAKEDGVPMVAVDGALPGLERRRQEHGLAQKEYSASHVLCVAGGIGACFVKQFARWPMPTENICVHFSGCYEFIEKACLSMTRCLSMASSQNMRRTASDLMLLSLPFRHRMHGVGIWTLQSSCRERSDGEVDVAHELYRDNTVMSLQSLVIKVFFRRREIVFVLPMTVLLRGARGCTSWKHKLSGHCSDSLTRRNRFLAKCTG